MGKLIVKKDIFGSNIRVLEKVLIKRFRDKFDMQLVPKIITVGNMLYGHSQTEKSSSKGG
jgi:hypothetical protein